jgi:hypothetical protein
MSDSDKEDYDEEMPRWARTLLKQQQTEMQKFKGELKEEISEIKKNVGNSPPKAKDWHEMMKNFLKEVKGAKEMKEIKRLETMDLIVEKYEKAMSNVEILGFKAMDADLDDESLRMAKLMAIMNPKKPYQGERSNSAGSIKCFKCGRNGHYANRCTYQRDKRVTKKVYLGVKKVKMEYPEVTAGDHINKSFSENIPSSVVVPYKRLSEIRAYLRSGAKCNKFKERYLSKEQKVFLLECRDKLLRENRIERIQHSEWLSPVHLVKKGDSYRLTMDYAVSGVNRAIENDPYPLPRIFESLQEFTKFKIFDKIDLKNGYWNMPIKDKLTKELVAFKIGHERFTWSVCPQGLKIAPSAFQRAMEEILDDIEDVLVYIDDIIIGGHSEKDLLEKRKLVLKRLKEYALTLNEKKSVYGQKSIPVLGYILKEGKVACDIMKVREIQNFGRIVTMKMLRKFLGQLNWIRKFYPQIQEQMHELSRMLKKDTILVNWTDKGKTAHEKILSELNNPIEFGEYQDQEVVEMFTDAGDEGYAAVFKQKGIVVGMVSHTWSKGQLGYNAMDKEITAIRFALRQEGPRLLGRRIIVWTDNAAFVAIWKKKQSMNNRVMRSLEELNEYDIEIKWKTREDPMMRLVDEMGRKVENEEARTTEKETASLNYLQNFHGNGYRLYTKIQGQDIVALLDSGATWNFMGRDLAERLGLRIHRTQTYEVHGVSMITVNAYAILELPIWQDQTISLKMWISNDGVTGGEDIILGEEFMEEYGVSWDFVDKSLYIVVRGINYCIKVDEQQHGQTRVIKIDPRDIQTSLTLPGIEPRTKVKIPVILHGTGTYKIKYNEAKVVESVIPEQRLLEAENWGSLVNAVQERVLVT